MTVAAARKETKEIEVDAALADEHGLSAEEWERLRGFLGRTPTLTELGITSALWSEHCSYKSSKAYLREFPTSGPRVLQGPGENAGVVDIGHGWVAVFKMESHNHPSFIEPYQGAATGVGGILRDVFTMGARPIACMDSLSFGELDAPRMRSLVDGVVRGIGTYGNCVGIPTVGGETRFHKAYNRNILVNAFALGVARRERIFRAKAGGPGNPILYAGSRTGRDGIHGATMASDVFDSESEKKKPTVQVGDPFVEKVVLEACLEAMRDASERGAIVAIQDMGAAGLTSSVFEMASRGKVGFTMDLDQVPLREPGLTAYEMMLSESQERMVLVVKRGREAEVTKVFRKWGLEVATIGEIRGGNRAEIRHRGKVVADIPIAPLTDDAPVYERPVSEPARRAKKLAASDVPAVTDPGATLATLLGTPELGSKEWIWRQYDHTVRTNTVIGPGGDAAVLRLKGTPSGLALTSDVNPVYCALDPRVGGRQAIAEAVRNLACAGAAPVGVTDCLNFGSPENPEILWAFREAVRGLADACRAFEIPVISGNVSLYNETEGDAILPTPTVGMVGLIDNLGEVPASHFRRGGDRIVLLGEDKGELGGSVYLRLAHGFDGLALGAPPEVDLAAEARLAALLRAAIALGLVHSAHDLAEGGLAVALAEATFGAGVGARLAVDSSATNLFSETQARALVAVGPRQLERFLALAEKHGVPAREAGETGGDRLRVDFDGGALDATVGELFRTWKEALPKALEL